MQLTLGELRAIIAEALEPHKEVVLDGDAIKAALSVPRDLERTAGGIKDKHGKVHGAIDYFAPYVIRTNFEPKAGDRNIQTLAKMNNAAKHDGFTPKEVVALLKRGEEVTASGVKLKAKPGSVDPIIEDMAKQIADHCRRAGLNIDIVVPIGSTSGMSDKLANLVAADLRVAKEDASAMAAKILIATEKVKYADISINEKMWQRYVASWREKGKSQAYIDGVRHDLEKELADLKRLYPEELAKISDQNTPHRRFITVHKPTESASELAGKHILVIDDNVDSGNALITHQDIAAQFGAASVTFAAGLDYKTNKRAA